MGHGGCVSCTSQICLLMISKRHALHWHKAFMPTTTNMGIGLESQGVSQLTCTACMLASKA